MTRSRTERTLIAPMALLVAVACGEPAGLSPPPPPSPPAPGQHPMLQQITASAAFPVDLATPPGGDDRMFVVEKAGRIRILRDGAWLAEPFLDITNRTSSAGERGLLGLAFAPDYPTSGLFVVHYTNTAGDTRVSTWRVSTDPDRADPTSEQTILAVTQPFSNHNGGQIAFGPDGMLYIALGDGGSAGDPQNHAQNLNSLLGKLLRLRVLADGTAEIPADNPFVGQANRRGEIWSYGLRNPWRFSFDPASGDLYIADVGQNSLEEINVASAASGGGRGVNFGWRIMEGTNCFIPSSGCPTAGLTEPAVVYGRSDGCSVTGGYVYRGAALGRYTGQYFYSDYCGRWVRSFQYHNGAVLSHAAFAELNPVGGITTFGVDGEGELWLATDAGRVYRIVRQ